MSDDLISRKAVIDIIENKRLLVGKHDLSAEYKLAGVQEQIEKLLIFNMNKVIEKLQAELNFADKEKERCVRENLLQFDTAKGYAQGISVALEIVKYGGVADE